MPVDSEEDNHALSFDEVKKRLENKNKDEEEQNFSDLCQLQWVDEKLQPGEDQIGSLLFDVQNNENSSFKVVKVPEAKSISLDDFDEVSGSLQFCV